MAGEASAKPGERQVAIQRAGWKMPILLTLLLLQAANALKGPRLVSGGPGGAVTIRCRYSPLSINKHARKYWCRISPVTRVCHTVVSTTNYTHLGYRGRVALADYPQGGLFVVTLSQLSPEDVGRYRCGIGNRNNMFFFSMNLTVSTDPSSTNPLASLATGERITRSSETASPAANRQTSGTTQTVERQGTGWDRIALLPGTNKTGASAEGRQTPGTTVAIAVGTASQGEGSVWATTVPILESLASTIRGVSRTTEGIWVWDTRGSVANTGRPSEERKETATEADGPPEETDWVRTALDVTGKVPGTGRPSTLVSGKWVQEILSETATTAAQPQALGSNEGSTPAASVWTPGPTSIEMASEQEATKGDLDMPVGDNDPQATPSQAPAAGSAMPVGKRSSMMSASPGEKNISRILIPVSTVLCPLTLVAFGLLQKKLWTKKMTQETERAAAVTLIQMTCLLNPSLQPDQLSHMERSMLRDDYPPQIC